MIGAVTDLLLGLGVIVNGAGVLLLARGLRRHSQHHARAGVERGGRIHFPTAPPHPYLPDPRATGDVCPLCGMPAAHAIHADLEEGT